MALVTPWCIQEWADSATTVSGERCSYNSKAAHSAAHLDQFPHSFINKIYQEVDIHKKCKNCFKNKATGLQVSGIWALGRKKMQP